MNNISKHITEAEEAFANRQYKVAMLYYGNLLAQFPQNQEYHIKVLLCDIAMEDEQKAQALFDYFTVEKDKNYNKAISSILDIIDAYDGDMDKLNSLLSQFSLPVESIEAISYDDFKAIVKSKKTFQEAFEDIVYSTKVIITEKDDFLDFIKNLIDNSYYDTAYNYIENSISTFSFDPQIQELTKELKNRLDK
jgi:hypothetical protein